MTAAPNLPIVQDDDAPYNPRAHGARCDICPLKGSAIVPPKRSYLPTKVVFVGEAPGRKEEIQGTPFVGMTGQYLRSISREVDLDIREAHLTNSALCRSNLDKENEQASVCCAPRLLRELADLPPEAPIVALGKSAALSILGTRSIMHARGFVWTAREVDPTNALKDAKKAKLNRSPKMKDLVLKAQIAVGRSKIAGRKVFPTVHPAFVLRSDTWAPILKLDMDRVARWLRGDLKPEHLLDAQPFTLVTARPNEVRGPLAKVCGKRAKVVAATFKSIRRELGKLKDVISIDIETLPSTPGGKDGANPLRNKMACVGVSDGDHTVVLWPWFPQYASHINWLFKRSRQIGMHNGYNFDQISLKRHGVPFEPVEEKLEDTLIAHHTFASHLPQRLAHVASVFCDQGPWKITFKRGGGEEKGLPPEKLPPEELVRYNAADAVIQAQTWLRMQEDLKPELPVYAVDKENARLCRGIGIDGIGVDLVRRKELLDAVEQKIVRLEGEMRALLKRPNFHPMQLTAVRKALFGTLRAPLAAADPTESGVPSTSSKTLERLKGSPTRAGRFANMLLEWRGAVKIKSTYILSQVLDKSPKKYPAYARTHFNWRSYGAASGRYSCRLQSCPRCEFLKKWELGGAVLLSGGGRETVGATVLEPHDGGKLLIRVDGTGVQLEVDAKDVKPVVLETRVRELYCARPGCKLVYFDLSQAELRFAAYLSGDKNYIAMCESGDVHTAIAQILFPTEAELIRTDPKGAGKPFRDVEKNSIFGFQYYADPTTIFGFCQAKGFAMIRMPDVLNMRDLVREQCADYFRYVERNKKFVDKYGYYRCPISGRISWLGWHAGYPDVANRPIQGGIAAIMNIRLPYIRRMLPPGSAVVAQIHDAAIMEIPDKYVERVAGKAVLDDKGKIKKYEGGLINKVWSEPVIIPADGFGSSQRVEDGARHFILPIDLKVGQRWSDFG
jgi:DNA polymerase